jgi:hypothetical protein
VFFTTGASKSRVGIPDIRVYRTLDELVAQAYTVWKERWSRVDPPFTFDDMLKLNNVWFGTKDHPPRRIPIAELRAVVEAKGY